MSKLVLDTNQIVEKDWRLRTATMRLVERAVELGLVVVVVPELVVEETHNKFRQKLASNIDKLRDSSEKAAKLIDVDIDVPTPNIDDECEKYEKYLNQRLEELNASRPGYSHIEQKWLVSKALKPSRPFHDGDRGYRDALIWHTVLCDIASSAHQTYFISNNKKDFGDHEGGFHPDLKSDLQHLGLEGYVTYMHDLQTFVESVIKPALEKIPSPLTVEDFEKLFDKYVSTIIDQVSDAIEQEGLPSTPNELFEAGPYIQQLELLNAEIVDAYNLDNTSCYTEFKVLVEAGFLQRVYLPDAMWIIESWSMNIMGDDEHHMELSFSFIIPLTIAVVTHIAEGVDPEFSVELQEFYGFCDHCGHPITSDAAEQCSECGRRFF